MLVVLLLLSCLVSACSSFSPGGHFVETPTVPQTNENLIIFCMDGKKDSAMIKLALNRYQEQYPDIQVELVMPQANNADATNRKELYQQVAAQIMAGEGPDVFIIDDTVMDVEKLVRQGIFADMEPFFTADSFNWQPYHQTIMDGGVWNGKRFLIPLSYDFPLLITSRTALAETGFDVDACNDYMGFLEETTRYMEDSSQTRQLLRQPLMVTDVTGFSGISIANYDTQTIDLSSTVLQSGYEWYKTIIERCPNSYGDYYSDIALYGAAAVRDGQILWSPPLEGALSGFYNEFGAIKTIDEAVMMPIRDVNGGIQVKIEYPVAVRANSENLQNAYDFIKILLSAEIQCAVSGEQLSVLNYANEYFFQQTSQGKVYHITAGENGFVSTLNPEEALDWPNEVDFQKFQSFIEEISDTYYTSHLGLGGAMYSFVYENANYDETVASAERKLSIYIAE